MAERSYRVLLWGLALLGLTLDQGTKYSVFSWLYNQGHGDVRPIIPGAFDILAQYTYPPEYDTGNHLLSPLRTWSGPIQPRVNRGALFGIGNGDNGWYANLVFAVVSLVAAIAIMVWSTRRSLVRDAWLSTALGLILGGTLGNLYDRVVFLGVRDFLHWHGGFDWPVFNIADCCLVVGASLLLLQALLGQPVQSPTDMTVAAESETTPAAS
jgi:lipoprotein signal peptidase